MSTTTYPTMTEPATTTGAAGFAAYKLALAFGLPAALSGIVVMLWVQPQSRREWAMALISTVMGSVCGGALLIDYFNLYHLADRGIIGLMAMVGIAFACGLPSWVIVRAWFAWADRRRNKDLAEIANEIRAQIKGDAA